MFNLNTHEHPVGSPPSTCHAGITQITTEPLHDRGLRLILLGAPGAGKGTQATLLKKSLGVSQFSTGDFFRAALASPGSNHSPALMSALRLIREGRLVPDDLVIEVVRSELHRLKAPSGVLLDGFPRTVPQAVALDSMLAAEQLRIDAVINYVIPTNAVIERLAHRRVCRTCKRSYHLIGLPPQTPGVCDHCQSELFQRDDDCPEAIKIRLDIYEQSTSPLIQFYSERGLLIPIDCSGSPEQTHALTIRALHH